MKGIQMLAVSHLCMSFRHIAKLITNSICAAYTLASSLAAYVTFTTAVSVSVFTVGQDKKRKRERGKKHEIQQTKEYTCTYQVFVVSVGESDTRPGSRGDPESCLSVWIHYSHHHAGFSPNPAASSTKRSSLTQRPCCHFHKNGSESGITAWTRQIITD